jgi:tetratricopeptide (TPR) repeat protein
MKAFHCHVDGAVVKGANGATQEVGQQLVDLCKGSVLALATMGNHLRGKDTPDEWKQVLEKMGTRLQDDDPELLPTDYRKTVFGVLDVVLDEMGPVDKEVVLALWQFRPGVALPLPLLTLAVQVESQPEFESGDVNISLDKIVKANLLEVVDGAAFMEASKGKKGYALLELVGMWLTKRNKGRDSAAFMQEPHGAAGPSSHAHAGDGEESSTAVESQRRCRLLAAFLATFGTLSALREARGVLTKALELKVDGWAGPELSIMTKGVRLAYMIDEGLSERAVVAAILTTRSAVKISMGRSEEALRDLDEADRLDPFNALTLFYRGLTKRALDRDEEALRDLDEADRLKPSVVTRIYRGATNFALGRYEEALQDLDEEPLLDLAWMNHTRMFNWEPLIKTYYPGIYRGRLREAERDLMQAEILKPNRAFILKYCGAAYWAKGLYEEALQDLDEADRLEPDTPFTLQMRGAVQWKRGMLDDALRDLDKAQSLCQEDDGDVLAFRAAVRLDRGEYDKALRDAQRALSALQARPHRHLRETPGICQDVLQRCQGERQR